MNEETLSKEEVAVEAGKMAHLFALLYYHFAKILVDEFGEEKGTALITKAVKNFALERGRTMREYALSLGLDTTDQSMREVSDLPRFTFYTDDNGTHCPFADVWETKGSIGQELGLIYCNVNDPYKAKGFNAEARLYRYIKNRNLGDPKCDSKNVEYLE